MKALFLALMLPVPALAEGAAEIRACLGDAYEPADCIGSLSRACMAGRADGETAAGMTECIDLETTAWNEVLEAKYQDVMGLFRVQDASGDVQSAQMTREATLRAAQRAWTRYVMPSAGCSPPATGRGRWGRSRRRTAG